MAIVRTLPGTSSATISAVEDVARLRESNARRRTPPIGITRISAGETMLHVGRVSCRPYRDTLSLLTGIRSVKGDSPCGFSIAIRR